MICIGNLSLRTMVLEYFNNSLYFKSYKPGNGIYVKVKKKYM